MKSNKKRYTKKKRIAHNIYALMQLPMNSYQNVEIRNALIRYYTKKGYFYGGDATKSKIQPTRKLLRLLQISEVIIPDFYSQQKLYVDTNGSVVKYINQYGEERYE